MPIDVVNGIKKPSSALYYQEGPPENLDIAAWRLVVMGAWGERRYSLSELQAFPKRDYNRRSVCVCNWTIRHTYSGLLLSDLLLDAGFNNVSEQGEYLKQTSIGTSEKGTYVSTIPLRGALERKALLCYEIEHEPLTAMRGFPLRLIDFGLYNYKCVKGLSSLELTHENELGEWERRAGYPLDGTVRAKKYWACDLGKSRYVASEGEVSEF
jgi:DMSO/TMAO reductase YedYZ molybdopterin-dependent catalytic subunit